MVSEIQDTPSPLTECQRGSWQSGSAGWGGGSLILKRQSGVAQSQPRRRPGSSSALTLSGGRVGGSAPAIS